LRDEIADVLALNGFLVDTAADGKMALAHVRAQRPDLIICDLTMPELDGYSTLQAIRGDPATELVPFLLLSGRESRQDVRHGMELGADDYITKPFKVEELLRAVTAALDKRARFERKAELDLDQLREHVALALPHELRTPLSAIIGYAEMLTDPGADASSPDVSSLAHQIIGASQRLNRMSENALLYVQLELLRGGRGLVDRGDASATTDLGVIVGSQARSKSAEYGRAGDLAMDLSDVRVAVNASYVAKIVDEIVDNACKFSEPGSPIRISTTLRSQYGTLCVTDGGCGMTDEQIGVVGGFTQFERSVREQQGLGLGLTIATRIAMVWAGSLAITSTPGVGTTVTVSLPTA
jgi:signal transduction histidine kinase